MPLQLKNQPPYYETVPGNPTTITLTDAQIKTIPTLEYQILEAPGPNKYHKIRSLSIYTDSTAGLYTFTGDAWLFLTTDDADWPLLSSFGQWSGGGAAKSIDSIPTPYTSVATTDIVSNAQPFNKTVDLINKPLLIRDWNVSTNYTGGHTDNFMKITIDYLIQNI